MITRALGLFVAESNGIEGIRRPPTPMEISAHERLLAVPAMTVEALEVFVLDVARAPMRRSLGMDVRVGSHRPQGGGPEIERDLCRLLDVANTDDDPYGVHGRYELLHPFMDGNGRSGRALWAWHMHRLGRDPFALPFLQAWYYQSLDAARKDWSW